ncbi:MAG: hypothetical protein NTV31_05240 [Bacteroidia bacterium]|nr:hypothetical protein [Bacteroidia bacterium]
MRTSIKILVILFVVITSSVIFTKQASAQQPYVSFQVFYDDLSPYGQWVNYSNFGYVWIPDAGPDFFPYSTGGHWIQTEYGLTWLSDYEWGWAPFHYGRWDYDDYFGWFWVPDNEWGPAWVTWRRAEGYYGWQPMQPGISISLSFDRGYDSHYDHWIFVRDRYIDRPNLNRYYANRTDHERIIRNSTVINNTYVDNRRQATYVSGPARDDIQRTTGRRVKPVAIQENSRPGQNMRNGQLQIYRPQVRNNDQGQKPVPSRVVNQSDVRRPSERNATNQTGNVNQPGNNRRVQQQNTVNKQNNNNTAKPVQTQNANPAQNNRRVVQQQQQKQQQQRQQEQQKQQQQQQQVLLKQQQKEQQQQQ